MKVTTNNIPRDVIYGFELTEQERGDFDYMDWDAIERGEDNADFFRYKGELYDLREFEVAPQDFPNWHGYQPDSFFSGMLVRYSEDFEQVTVGWYMT